MQKSNWKKCKLGDALNFHRGYDLPRNQMTGRGYPVIGSNGVIGYHSKYTTTGPCLVIGRSGNTGKPSLYRQPCWAHNTTLYVDDFKGNDSQYLYYLISTMNLGSYAAGSAVPTLNRNHIHPLEISLPPIEEQKRIAGVLGAFDDKIELLQKQNKTLENIAKALFKSWFVDFDVVHAKQQGQSKAAVMQQYHLTEELYNLFPSCFEPSSLGPIPTGWQVKPLSQIATFLNGLALQKYPANDNINYLPVIKIAELRNGLSTSSDRASCDIPAEYIVYNGDILFSWSGSLMVKIWPGKKGALNQHLFKVSSLEYPKWFYYMWIKYQLPFFQEIAADKATTMGHIQRKHLDQALVCIPKNLNIYTRYFASLIDKQILNNKQIQTLTEMRDALLPRLISGKIRV